jgi:hypothetical protein
MGRHIEVDDETAVRLRELIQRSGAPEREVVGAAISALHRTWIGDSTEQLGIPFKKRWSELDADVVLRQETPVEFRMEEAFRYEEAGGEIVVEAGDATDLASVPGFLTWLVPRYGRHTLPALLHDHLVEPGMDPSLREEADTTFRDAMGATQVPVVRRWVMWAAVSLATNWLRARRWKMAVAAWILLYALAGFDLLLAAFGVRPFPQASSPVAAGAILLSPLVTSAVWGRRYRFGLIVAYSLVVLPASVVAVTLTLIVYLVAEWAAQLVLRVQRRRGADVQISPVRLSKL